MNMLTREVLAPMITRIGTGLSGYLMGAGVAASDAEKIAVGVITIVLVGVDLTLAHFARKATDK